LTLAVFVVALVLGGITAIGWEVVLGPKARPVAGRKFDVTDARLARGKYLVEGPAACFHCHSEHDFTNPDYPIIEAKKGAGWVMPIPELTSPRGTSPRIRRLGSARGPTTRSRGRFAKASGATARRCFR
jgi:hypothetical protein